MKRILIDLTDLETWSGHHGGTQRVVYGIAKEFYDRQDHLKEEILFMSFSNADKSFHLSDFTPIMQRVAESVESSNEASANQSPTQVGRRKELLKRSVRKYVPESVWRDPRFKAVARKAIHQARRVKHAIDAQAKSRTVSRAAISREQVTLQDQDVVLILGKPWDNPGIQRYLGHEKQHTKFKLVQVVYDMIICLNPHLHHPSLFKGYTQHMFEAMSTSDILLPISQSTANDVKIFAKRLNLPVPAMQVIRLGDTINTVRDVGERPDKQISANFILCVGTVEIRKNHTLLYYAYRLALERDIELPQLVIIGSRGWLTGDLQYLIDHDPAMKDRIVILDNVSDAGLDWLYRNCRYTVYPSMYEGWGLPVAESLGYGKFCIASNSSSVPEIAGNLIEYASPYDPAAYMDLMRKYSDDKLLQKKETDLIKHYKTTDWSETFSQTYESLT